MHVPRYYRSYSQTVHDHLWTARLWTAITFFQTASLLLWYTTPNLIGNVVAMIAGWTMVSSWRQLKERRQSGETLQNHRPLPHRLFVQTFWGPLSIWIAVEMIALLQSAGGK